MGWVKSPGGACRAEALGRLCWCFPLCSSEISAQICSITALNSVGWIACLRLTWFFLWGFPPAPLSGTYFARGLASLPASAASGLQDRDGSLSRPGDYPGWTGVVGALRSLPGGPAGTSDTLGREGCGLRTALGRLSADGRSWLPVLLNVGLRAPAPEPK